MQAQAAAASEAMSGHGKSLDSIAERVQKLIPEMSKEAILSKIDIVRKNNGTLKGVTVKAVAKRIRELNERGFFLSCFCFQNFPFS
jgi:hypothetical protein